MVRLVCEGCGEDKGAWSEGGDIFGPDRFLGSKSADNCVFVPSIRELYSFVTDTVVAAGITHGQCM